MTLDLLIANGKLVTADGIAGGSIGISSGRVAGIFYGDVLPTATEVVDAHGGQVLPGVVDLHVHFREPGLDYKATYLTESAAAAAGGVTTVFDMPNNGCLAVISADRLAAKLAVAGRSSYVDFGAYAYLCSRDEGEVASLVAMGVAGFKWDMSLAGTEVAPGVRLPEAADALPYFEAVARAGAIIGVHAEDRPLVLERTSSLRAQGRSDAAAHAEARPVEAEVRALRQAIDLCRRSGARLHVHHLSSSAGVGVVREAKREGLPITAETIPPFLFLDARDYPRLGTVIKIHPAVKYEEDRRELWTALVDGTIDCLATDHAPHTAEEKTRDIWQASPGAIGVQTSLPLMLGAAHDHRIDMRRLVDVMSTAPARLYGLLPRKGTIAAGSDADLVVVDPEARIEIRNADMLTPNRLTPFDGVVVAGAPTMTFLRGKLVASHGRVIGEPTGRHVAPGYGSTTA